MKSLILSLIFFSLISCQPGSGRTGSSSFTPAPSQGAENSIDPEVSISSQEVSFFHNQSNSSNLQIAQSFNGQFLLRGGLINEFLSLTSENSSFCFISQFNQGVLSLRAQKRSFFDFTSRSTQFFLEIATEHTTDECNSLQIQSSLTNLFSSSVHFSLGSVCPSCNQTTSQRILLLDPQSLSIIPSVNLSALQMSLVSSPAPPSPSAPATCTSNNDCSSNFDCCSNSVCVTHASIRNGVDTTDPSFLAIQELIARGEDNISNFPQFFNFCPNVVVTTPPESGSALAQFNLNSQQDLADCLSEGIDEVAVCPLVIEDFEGSSVSTNLDDLNFSSISSSIPLSTRSIVEVRYAGQILYQTDNNIANLTFSGSNDNFNQAETVSNIPAPAANAPHSNLVIRFKVDRTCRQQGNFLRCEKFYTIGQGSTPPRPSDAGINQTVFSLPAHASTSSLGGFTIVHIDDIPVAQSASGWEFTGNQIRINQPIGPGQEIRISYLSTLPVNNLTTFTGAQQRLRSFCGVTTDDHFLEPEIQNGQVVAFSCRQREEEDSSIPLQESLSISLKTAPVALYNINGVRQSSISSANDQEGNQFNYSQGNFIPNNLTQYIGFNEIYGNLVGQLGAHPAREIEIVRGRTYDLTSGISNFTPCPTCGTSVYGNGLQELFPDFNGTGGGYIPHLGDERSNDANNTPSPYRANDLLFGRACFLPASMIPWSHQESPGSTQVQRLNRLSTQHALFANGYKRDWFGFDYGAVIGSFDGVRWFAIGEQRRITAETNRLFLAVNAYFSDLTQPNNIGMTITEIVNPQTGGAADFESDISTTGAQCQLNHLCDTDNDCIAQLGYEYSCQNVVGLESNWPTFDINANEVQGSQKRTLTSLIGGTEGQSRRCVYRGAGAPCARSTTTDGSAFNNSTSAGLQTCAANFYCANVSASDFNTKIARIPFTANSQNANSDLSSIAGLTDIFGKSSRLLGRSLNYYGSEALPSSIQSQLLSQGIEGVCLPGKDPSLALSFEDLLIAAPSINNADRVLGIGVTQSGLQSDEYYSSCPATDSSGEYVHLAFNNQPTDFVTAIEHSATQNLSTNLLEVFNISSLFVNPTLIGDFAYEANRCLRAAGASCFSDLECAPSEFIAQEIANNISSASLTEAEQSFWQEELVCSQREPQFINVRTNSGNIAYLTNDNHDLKENRCCRQTNNDITIASELFINAAADIASPDTPDTSSLPGIDTTIDSARRYSRVNTVYDLLTQSNFPALQGLVEGSVNQSFNTNLPYYKTFDAMAKRTCCSENWVRRFHPDNNGSNNLWGPTRLQDIERSTFRSISWLPNSDPTAPSFECGTNPVEPNFFLNGGECEIKNLTPADQDAYLEHFQNLELLGIPQAFVQVNSVFARNDVDDSQNADSTAFIGDFLTGALSTTSGEAAGNDQTKFGGSIRKIFSEDQARCCLPSSESLPLVNGQSDPSQFGIEQDISTTDDMCCSGNYSDTQRRCCVPDYTNISVYLNRNVSSEAANLPDSSFDKNGFIRDRNVVLDIANRICCSGRATFGRAIANLPIPSSNGQAIQDNTSSDGVARTERFLYRSQGEIDVNGVDVGSFYDQGAKWNNHVYCLPQE